MVTKHTYSEDQIAYLEESHKLLCEIGEHFELPMPEYRWKILKYLKEKELDDALERKEEYPE